MTTKSPSDLHREALASQYPSMSFWRSTVSRVSCDIYTDVPQRSPASTTRLDVLISFIQFDAIASLTGCIPQIYLSLSLSPCQAQVQNRLISRRTPRGLQEHEEHLEKTVHENQTLCSYSSCLQNSSYVARRSLFCIFHVEMEWFLKPWRVSLRKYLCVYFISDHVRSRLH